MREAEEDREDPTLLPEKEEAKMEETAVPPGRTVRAHQPVARRYPEVSEVKMKKLLMPDSDMADADYLTEKGAVFTPY